MKQETFTELPKVFKTMISKVVVDGKEYKNIEEWYDSLNNKEGHYKVIFNMPNSNLLKVIVKERALSDTPFFKFNEFYNHNKPIPKTEMYGVKVEEKYNMIKMDLWDKDHKMHWDGWILKSNIVECKNVKSY